MTTKSSAGSWRLRASSTANCTTRDCSSRGSNLMSSMIWSAVILFQRNGDSFLQPRLFSSPFFKNAGFWRACARFSAGTRHPLSEPLIGCHHNPEGTQQISSGLPPQGLPWEPESTIVSSLKAVRFFERRVRPTRQIYLRPLYADNRIINAH